MRLFEVSLTIRLDRLHLVLQAAMGWTNSHLYEIRALSGAGPIQTSATDRSTPANAWLIDVLEDTAASDFDPTRANVEVLTHTVHGLVAKKRSRRPSARKRS